jgi:hypothetical protein
MEFLVQQNPINPIVDGDAAVLMRVLRNHTSLELDRLKALVNQHFDNDDTFGNLLRYTEKMMWVEVSDDQLRLTEAGELWLDKNGAEFDIEEEDPGNSEPKKPYDVAKLKMESKNISVFQALRKIEKKEIHMNPDFQRAFVWDIVKQSRLIESILIRIPLPAFYLDASDQVRWNVVDGLQRLTTLYRYCRDPGFELTGLQFLGELNGCAFKDLPAHYKVLIEDDTQLLFYNLMPGTPIEAKFTIFSRVNTGGMQLTPQEIRHALSQGKITDLLGKIAKSFEFKNATEGVVESLRMSDRELILRAMAFMHLGFEAYKQFNELDAFLLHAMSEFNKLPDERLRQLEKDFLDSLAKVRALFGRYAFRKFYEVNGRRSPLNKALFEVWVVSVRKYSQKQLLDNKAVIIKGFIDLLNIWEGRFLRSISASTGSFSAVSTRFSEIEKLLEKNIR